MASELIKKISSELLKRAAEETMQSAIEEGIRSGDDTNSLTKRVFKSVLGDSSPLASLVRKYPGTRFAPNVGLSLAAEYLSSHADGLFRGDNRAPVQALRLALKAASPMLVGIGDATADVLEKQVGASVDRVVSPVGATGAKKDFDWIVVVPTFFGMGPFYPVKTLADGSVGYLEIDGYKIPDVTDSRFLTFRDNWLREHPAKKVSQGGGKGQPPRVESVLASVPWHVHSLQEYITLIGRNGGMSESVLADLERRFRPASAGQEYSEDTWAVFRAVVRTQRHFTDLKQRDQLDRQDFESLIEKFLKSGVSVFRVDQMIGKAFASRIDKETGLLTLVALRDFETTVDVFLCGEQGMFTTIQRRWRELRREGYAQGDATWWLSLGVIGFTAPIWAPMCLVSFLLLAAVYMAVAGVFTPLEGTQTLFGREISGKSYAFWMAFASGWLAFATTWIFSILQTLLAWIRNFFPSLKPDWLVSLGHRISGFGLTIISTMIPVAILLGATWEDRVLVIAATGFTMGMAYVLVEAGWKYHVERSVLKASPWLNAVFGAGLLAYAFTHPVFVSHPKEARAAVSLLGSAKDAVANSKWLQLGAVLVAMLVIVVILSLVEYRKVTSGAYRLRIRGVGLLLTLIVLAFVGHIFFSSSGKTSVKQEETTSEVAKPKRQKTSEQVSPASSPQGAIDMEVFCAQELSFETRQEYCQKKEEGR